jgi:hypothetical protein
MKTFLTICTCAMVTAGIYGFTDMAIDVKNGTMIEYDHGDSEEAADISTAVVAEKMLQDKKAGTKKQVVEEKVIKKETTATTKVKTKKKTVKKEARVVDENPIRETVVIEETQTDVKADSAVLIESREIDYREFSRGAPRKVKKNKKSKKD